MVYCEMPCGAEVARESRALLDVAMKGHIKECDLCIRELINDFVNSADVEDSK